MSLKKIGHNLDIYKINNNNLYIEGWIHDNFSKMIVVSKNEEIVIDSFIPRYDISILFNEEITSNNGYGFKKELTFKNNVTKAKIYIINDKNERKRIFTINDSKIAKICRRIGKGFNKLKRGIKFLWREYHFIVPPKMLLGYIRMALKKSPKKVLYNPEIVSEYNDWLLKNSLPKDKIKKLDNLTFINETNYKDYKKVKTEYVCLEANDIEKSLDFFTTIKEELNKNYDVIYFDNDFIIDGKYQEPFFKPDYSPETLLGINYIGNMFIIKTSLLKDIKCKEFNLYKILLSLINKDINYKHIAKILYHDNHKITNGKKEVEEYIKDNKINARIHENRDGISNIFEYIPSGKNLVSIIIPTKDHADILKTCLESIYQKTTYKKYEIIVIDNNSCEQSTFDLLKEYDKKHDNFSYKRIECEFNYSYLNNEAVKMAKGEYVLLLNNDIEVITPEWLERMLGYAEQKHIGTVGAKLIFPDETIQHAGIIMGKGGLAGHAHYGCPKNKFFHQYELSIPYNYSASTAACLLIAKKKYEEVNGLEEKLKVAFNDVDFNLKVLEKGYYNVYLPNVELYHYESKSRGLDTSKEKQKRFMQEYKYIESKWKKYIEHDRFYNDNFSKDEDFMLK